MLVVEDYLQILNPTIMKSFSLIFVICLISFSTIFASHNRAGEIRYTQTSEFGIEASIVTYTNAGTISGNSRDSLLLCWGDGNCDFLLRVNGPDDNGNGVADGELLSNNNRLNIYTGSHNFAAYDDYILSMTDPNRNAGILNINGVSSDNVPFHIQTSFSLSANYNSSPTLLEPPIDLGFVGVPFMHVANAYDADGDSISYKLVSPLQDINIDVPLFLALTEVNPGPENNLSFDEETGLIVWDAPQIQGDYSLAIEIISYRNGQVVGRMIRDMMISVSAAENSAPALTMENDPGDEIIDVEVGDQIQLTMLANDFDSSQSLFMTATSGLFGFSSPPVFESNNGMNIGEATFDWTVTADQARPQPYQIAFKTFDDAGASNFLVYRYRVLGWTSSNESELSIGKATIYPNPSSKNLYVNWPSLNIEQANYSIYDLQGRLVKQASFESAKQISIENLRPATYVLSLGGQYFYFVKQ